MCPVSVCWLSESTHKRGKITAGHECVSVDKAMKGKMKASVLCCERHHHHLEINTYCHMDRQAICAECILDHKGHDVDRIVNVVQGFKDEIAQLVDEVCSVFFFLSLFLFFFSSSSSSSMNGSLNLGQEARPEFD